MIDVPGSQNAQIPASIGAPDAELVADLTGLGDTTTAAQLDQLNFNYLNPTGAAYNVTGTVQEVNTNLADVTYFAGFAPGAVIAGQNTAVILVDVNGKSTPVSVQAYNILQADSDISTDSINNVQKLIVGSDVTLLNAQFYSFSTITSGLGRITAADGGTFDLTKTNAQGIGCLAATDMIGTTLIGNDQAGQVLRASPYGNDTLKAGNGAGDELVAGAGVDTLIGGTGGDFSTHGRALLLDPRSKDRAAATPWPPAQTSAAQRSAASKHWRFPVP